MYEPFMIGWKIFDTGSSPSGVLDLSMAGDNSRACGPS